ncbi:MAG: DUF6713 family protein [Cyanobacteria bacterium J06623_4]
MADIIFYVGLAMLLTHELDAMTHQEWRLLFVLRKLPEPLAKTCFLLLHVPLFGLLLWAVGHDSTNVVQRTKSAIALFLAIHAALHYRLRYHPKYTFHSLLSASLIYGGGVFGLLYIFTLLVSSDALLSAVIFLI